MKKVTVSECNEWISHLFNKDYTLHNLAVSGTVSNLRIHSSGRVYFSLMDSKGRIFCIISPERRTFLTRRLYVAVKPPAQGLLSTVPEEDMPLCMWTGLPESVQVN